jgi:murein DD-endopeptidase MepM/ murein hydrolase activator NlpD
MFLVSWMRRPFTAARTAGRRADWAAQRETRSDTTRRYGASARDRSITRSTVAEVAARNVRADESSNSMMRPHFVSAALGLALASTACTRPVLYYPDPDPAPSSNPAASSRPARTPSPSPSEFPDATVAVVGGGGSSASDAAYLMSRKLMVPVAGADMSKVEDSFYESRDGGRTHRAIDILAPRGTPILAADDGKILRMTTSELGGISMYTVDPDARLVYYYAHMERYNDAMSPGREIVRGDTLGYVGTTGNAPKDTPHLHFQVMRWPADNKYWDGDAIDPYDALGGTRRQGSRLRD